MKQGLLLLVLLGSTSAIASAASPSRFFRVDGLEFQSGLNTREHRGIGSYYWDRLGELTYLGGRFRIGTTLLELSGPSWGATAARSGTFLPLRVGYAFYQRPVIARRSYNMVPIVSAEATIGPGLLDQGRPTPSPTIQPFARFALRGQVDYFGIGGVSLEFGVLSMPMPGPVKRLNALYAGIGLHLLAVNSPVRAIRPLP